MFHAGRLPTKKRHNAETNSPVQPMGTYRRRVFLESIMGRAFHAEMGGKALILGPRPSQPWENTKGAGIFLPMEQLQGQMSFLQQRGYRAQKTGAYSRIACEAIFRRHTPIIFVATKEIEVFQKSVEVSADSWT